MRTRWIWVWAAFQSARPTWPGRCRGPWAGPSSSSQAWGTQVVPPWGWAPSAEAPGRRGPHSWLCGPGPCCAPRVRVKAGPSVCREEDGPHTPSLSTALLGAQEGVRAGCRRSAGTPRCSECVQRVCGHRPCGLLNDRPLGVPGKLGLPVPPLRAALTGRHVAGLGRALLVLGGCPLVGGVAFFLSC